MVELHKYSDHHKFIDERIEKVYPNQWRPFGGGFGALITVGNQGVLVTHDDLFFTIGTGILSHLSFSKELVTTVASRSIATTLGSMTLSEGSEDTWVVAWGLKLLLQWLDPSSHENALMIEQLLEFAPMYGEAKIAELQPKFGGREWGIEDPWWFLLMDKY